MNNFTTKIDQYFGIKQSGSNLRTEIWAGCATFLTMSYILFVNPMILGAAIDVENSFPKLLTATAFAAAVGTLLMGLYTKYPFALAPGMGLNAYFAYEVCGKMEIAWQTALGAVFISGIIFLLLSALGIRQWLVNSIPPELKIATSCGIGFFLAIIGCNNSGLIVSDPNTLVTLGNLTENGPQLALFGLLLTAVMLALRMTGAILIGIIMTTVLAIGIGAQVYPGPDGMQQFQGFAGFIKAPVLPTGIMFQLDIPAALKLGWSIIFIFLFVDFFDTAGTLIGLSAKAGYLDQNGNLPKADKAFSCDAIATSTGAIFGSSTTTSYIESAAGIEEGGQTGFTAVVVGILFLLSIFLWPLASAIPAIATAPALILIGSMMMANIGRIEWQDYRKAIPAFLTIISMPLTYSIANGISFGIIAYTVIHLLSGKFRQVHILLYIITALLIFKYIAFNGG